MLQLIFFILFTSGFTESQGKNVICNSSDVEISYSFCGSECVLWRFHQFMFCLFLIGSDIIFLEGSVNVWYDARNILAQKKVICSGFDDDYSFCGTLKGETLNATFEMSGLKMKLPKVLSKVYILYVIHMLKVTKICKIACLHVYFP
uniref:Lymphocyte antigen 96 n=1 Tax=Chelonoidis abingdonii TaxID=106734 RepID=A0A8C0GK46_CHEAB